jgi:hypothetical protein
LATGILLAPLVGFTQEDEMRTNRQASTLILTIENDSFAGTDRHYTSGLRVGWVSSELADYRQFRLPDWSVSALGLVPFADRPGTTQSLSVAVGQNIYSPENTHRTDLIRDDRPYAAWLYLALGIEVKDLQRSDALELQIGVVGPLALGEEAQKSVHNYIGADEPRGWDNQLENEPGINLVYERRNRLWRSGRNDGAAADLISNFGASVGNVNTYANVGATARVGWNVPRDFGVTLIRPGGGSYAPIETDDPRVSAPPKYGFYVAVGVDGRAVARNIFLDGNTFEESHDVDKEYYRADFTASLVLILPPWTLSYTHVYRTREFQEQDEGQRFGSLTVAVSF